VTEVSGHLGTGAEVSYGHFGTDSLSTYIVEDQLHCILGYVIVSCRWSL